MDEELGEACVAALAAISPHWRREIEVTRLEPGWSLTWIDRGKPELITVLLRSTAVARLRTLTMRRHRIAFFADFTLPDVERVEVRDHEHDHGLAARFTRGSRVDMAALVAIAPNMTSLSISAETIRPAAGERLRSLALVTRGLPAWNAMTFPALETLELQTEDPAADDDVTWLLDGKLAPALRRLRLAGPGVAALVSQLPAAPAVKQLADLHVATDVTEQIGRALVANLGHLARVGKLRFHDAADRKFGSSMPWLVALQRSGARRKATAQGLLRGHELFFAAPHPAVRCWEFKATGKGATSAGVVQIRQDLPGGPATLEEGLCALVGAWRRYSSSGWYDPSREPGQLARFEPGAWESLIDRSENLFGALEPAAFDAALDAAIDAMHAAPDVRVTENYARLLPRSFTPPVGPANRAYATTNEPADKLLVAETDDAFVLLVWIG